MCKNGEPNIWLNSYEPDIDVQENLTVFVGKLSQDDPIVVITFRYRQSILRINIHPTRFVGF